MINCTVLFRILIGIVLISLCYSGIAQDSLLMRDSINQVLILASKLESDDHTRKELLQDDGLVQSLNKESAVQLQSNGPGFLATPLIHGFGARHTAILWNNFNIQSPINGTFDLNLITGFDKVSYIDKSTSAYLGTASLAGAILLDYDDQIEDTQISLSYSSIENLRLGFSHDIKSSKFESNIQVDYISNNNAFDYEWAASKSVWQSLVNGFDVKFNNEYQINDNLTWQANVWLQEFDREIPSSLVSTIQVAEQSDNNYRYNTSLNYSNKDLSGVLSYARFYEELNYATPGVDSKAKNTVNALNLSISKSKHLLNLSHRQDEADANFFEGVINRKLTTLSYRFKHHWSTNLNSTIVLTEERFDDDWSPLIFDVSTRYLSNNIELSLALNRAYNVPTLNDLYWPQGGNPNLLPESSLGFDLDFRMKVNREISLSIDPYYKSVNNWILWSPGDQFWTPKNQRSVTARGVDIALDFRFSKALSGNLNTSLNSTTVSKELRFKDLEGKQLIYVPRVKSSLMLNYSVDSWSLKPELFYFSKRFVTTDNEGVLPSYSLVNLSIDKQVKIDNKNRLRIGIKGFNILNNVYQQVQFYPMPLRYFEFNLKYKIERNE